MPQNVYTAMASIPVPGSDAAILATIENPADSGVLIAVIGLVEQATTDGQPPPMTIRHYAGTISVSVVDVGLMPVAYPHLSASPAASAIVRTVASHSFTPPVADPTFEGALEMLQSFPPTSAVFVAPGETGALWSRDGGGDIPIMFAIQWAEVAIAPVEHIAIGALPGSGAFTTADGFAVPDGWTSVTAWLTYTAANGTTTARPKWRVSVSPNGSTWFPLPVVDQTPDVSVSPEARRDVYQQADVWKNVVAANATIYVPISFSIPPGAPFIRLDVAEHGQTALPGTVAVSLTGA